jgi:uncharacterized protein (DUF433 family)
MEQFNRISQSPAIMGGKACIKGTRVTVGNIMGLISEGYTNHEILEAYPFLIKEDIKEVLKYAAWRVNEQEYELVA